MSLEGENLPVGTMGKRDVLAYNTPGRAEAKREKGRTPKGTSTRSDLYG